MNPRRLLGWTILALLLIIAAAVPPSLGRYQVSVATLIALYVILASSLNLLLGYGGQFSIAHAAFYGIGAYTSALLVSRLAVPFWPAVAGGVALTGGVAVVLGTAAFASGLRGPYLAIVTFSFGELVRLVLNNWSSVTRGAMGITVTWQPPPLLGLVPLDSPEAYYYLVLAVAVLTVLTVDWLAHSSFGRALRGIAQDETLAAAAGINIFFHKLAAFVIASSFAGLAGALVPTYLQFISPELFGPSEGVFIMALVVIGGMGTMLGPVVASIALPILPLALNMPPFVRSLVYGSILILVMMLLPRGLVGAFRGDSPLARSFRRLAGSAPGLGPATPPQIAELGEPAVEPQGPRRPHA